MSQNSDLFLQRILTLQTLPREAWKNQRGWTRTVASALGANGQVDWRVSVAEITSAGPFSVFEGMDRQAVMLQGAHLRLRAEQAEDDIYFNGPGGNAAFPGERLLVTDTPGEPTALWNVMHRRGRVSATLGVFSDTEVHLPPAHNLFVYVLSGEMELTLPLCRPQGLSAGQILRLHLPPEKAVLAPSRAGSQVLITAIS